MTSTGSPELSGGWIARRWSAVRGVIAAIAVLCLAAAVLLLPPVAARLLSTDGELTDSSRFTLYIIVSGLVGLAFAAALLWRRWRTCTPGRERIALGAAMLAGSVLVSGLAAEIGLMSIHRFVRPLGTERHYFLSYDPVLGWKHRPGTVATYKTTLVRIDADGFRVADGARDREDSRVLLVGDSQAFGDGVSAEETFGAQLEAKNPGLRVLNAAVIGYATDQELLYFETRGKAFAPNVTVLSMNAFDLRENLRSNVRNGYEKPRFVVAGDGLKLTNVPVPGDGPLDRADRAVQQHSHVYRLLRGIDIRTGGRQRTGDRVPLGRRIAEQVYPSGELFDESLQVTASMLERFSAGARQVGSHLVVLFMPYEKNFSPGSADYNRYTDRFLQVMKDRSVSGGFTVVDGREALAELAEKAYIDAYHLSPEGHRRVAALLDKTLSANQLITRKHAN